MLWNLSRNAIPASAEDFKKLKETMDELESVSYFGLCFLTLKKTVCHVNCRREGREAGREGGEGGREGGGRQGGREGGRTNVIKYSKINHVLLLIIVFITGRACCSFMRVAILQRRRV